MYQQLSRDIQPFCADVEKQVGEFLDIRESLYPVQVEFPSGDREHFSADLNKQIDTMITRAKGTLEYEPDSDKKKVLKGRVCIARLYVCFGGVAPRGVLRGDTEAGDRGQK